VLDPADLVTWAQLLADAVERLRAAGLPSPEADARRLVEQASGWEGAEHALHLEDLATTLAATVLAKMLDRRADGEPLQYVLGRWGFRELDLYVDRRVLIPRPETEQVVEAALVELDRLVERRAAAEERPRPAVAVDLGTGSGAVALSLAVERAEIDVWATDVSDSALAVARANLAGAGRPAARIRVAIGSWYAALPDELRGAVDVIVSNPPYVAEPEVADLPPEVADWEPVGALVAGPTGLEAIEAIVGGALEWLARPGVLVVEHAPHQSEAVKGLARAAGFAETETRPDLAGRERMLVARRG
jgi:release factor glutamine methyltransferase